VLVPPSLNVQSYPPEFETTHIVFEKETPHLRLPPSKSWRARATRNRFIVVADKKISKKEIGMGLTSKTPSDYEVGGCALPFFFKRTTATTITTTTITIITTIKRVPDDPSIMDGAVIVMSNVSEAVLPRSSVTVKVAV
jgi:hypothetical protein